MASANFASPRTLPIRVYPKPATHRLMVELPAFALENVPKRWIIAANGQMIQTIPLLPQAVQAIDLSDLPRGLYTLFSHLGGEASALRFVKQ